MTVYIKPGHGNDEATRVAQLLLGAADDPRQVKTDTTGDGLVFAVPEELAAKVDLNPPKDDVPPAAKKKTGRKAAS